MASNTNSKSSILYQFYDKLYVVLKDNDIDGVSKEDLFMFLSIGGIPLYKISEIWNISKKKNPIFNGSSHIDTKEFKLIMYLISLYQNKKHESIENITTYKDELIYPSIVYYPTQIQPPKLARVLINNINDVNCFDQTDFFNLQYKKKLMISYHNHCFERNKAKYLSFDIVNVCYSYLQAFYGTFNNCWRWYYQGTEFDDGIL
eukprot:69701_1